ncbi:hypothetical protein HELRODRAFT_182340 [Helobdella robusta]|uniref:Ig-like domain-containing protein n=1 Tax=Helobdella robusta TaxID=6412 RepID=T1FI30_HELRO|nr:hypothetical protein HELRODRAFT_182340 [Helobdella robusta]ESN90995.1 hypothetical protein HELRODRAFT_182340 [Helobdella robusta]
MTDQATFFSKISTGNVYITVAPSNLTAMERSKVKLMCRAEGESSANLTYTWFKNGINVWKLPLFSSRVESYADSSLVIRDVSKDDIGWYTCRHPIFYIKYYGHKSKNNENINYRAVKV